MSRNEMIDYIKSEINNLADAEIEIIRDCFLSWLSAQPETPAHP